MKVVNQYFSMSFDVEPLLRNLEMFTQRIDSQLVRPAAQAGAQQFYDEVRTRVSALGDTPEMIGATLGLSQNKGNLLKAIYQKYIPEKSNGKRATYWISWRTGKVEQKDKDGNVITVGGLAIAPHGHLVEFGHWRRYKAYRAKNGQWYTLVHPKAAGLKTWYNEKYGFRSKNVTFPWTKPSRRQGFAAMSKYYWALDTPVRVPGKGFIRGSYEAKKNTAGEVMLAKMRSQFVLVMTGGLQ